VKAPATALALAAVVMLPGCTGDSSPSSARGRSTSATETTPVSAFRLPLGTSTRTCVPVVTGGLSNDWPHLSVVAGPLAIVYADQWIHPPPDALRPDSAGRYAPLKQLVLVRPGTRVALIVRSTDRERFSLLYSNAASPPGLRVRTTRPGSPGVVFSPCPAAGSSGWVQFPGAMIALGPQCAHLQVAIVDDTGNAMDQPIEVALGIGRTCPSR
jgi:hypothetical protein